jgi:putative thioredoxin
VAQEDFQREVLDRSRERPVVVDFWAPWCGPCRALGPVLERLAAQRQGAFLLAKVNIDEAQELAYEYGIEAIPAIRAFRDGRAVLGFNGLLPEPQLNDFLDRIVPSEVDTLVHRAATLEATDAPEAEALYRRAVEQDRNHEAAVLGLVRVLVNRGEEAEASELLTRVGPRGALGEEAERLDAILWLRRRGREIGDLATAQQRLDAEPQNAVRRYEMGTALAAAGRYAEALPVLLAAAEADHQLARAKVREVMVKVFQVIGVRSPLADEYRDKLSRLLY